MKYLFPNEEFKFEHKFQVLYFYASWMNFHNRFIKMISSFEEKNNNFNFLAIDVDFHKNLCQRFDVSSIPSIVILVDGKEVKKTNGLMLTSAFKSILNDIYNKYKEKENDK